MIDNYDSFTYNIVQYLGELGADVTVKRNDAIDVAGIRALHPGRGRHLARTVHSHRGRNLAEAAARDGGRSSDSRRLPRPAMYRRGVRRQGRARGSPDARQDLADNSRRQNDFRGHPQPVRRDALSFAAGRCGVDSAGAGSQRAHRGKRNHGTAPQTARGRRRAVSSRIDPDLRGQASAEKLSRPRRRRTETRDERTPRRAAGAHRRALALRRRGRTRDRRDHGRRRARRRRRRVPGGAENQGRRGRRAGRRGACDAQARASAQSSRRRRARHLRHRRRRRQHLQHLDRRRADRRGGGRAGRQARQSRDQRHGRHGRRARGDGREDRLRPRRAETMPRRGRMLPHLRASRIIPRSRRLRRSDASSESAPSSI